MTTPNPDAIDAGARALFGNDTLWDHAGPGHRATAVRQARTAYAAMEPHIRRQVAEELTATTGIHVRAEIRKILDQAGNFPSGDQLDAMAQEVIDLVVPAARLQERQQIADELRAMWRDQSGWLWFEIGESALEKVAAHIAPQRHPRDDTGRNVQNGETA